MNKKKEFNNIEDLEKFFFPEEFKNKTIKDEGINLHLPQKLLEKIQHDITKI